MEVSCDVCKHKDLAGNESPCDVCDGESRFERAPAKTLLDEFAMAAMAAIVGKRPYIMVCDDEELETVRKIIAADCRGAYEIAAAMMKERARRDEMGNVKEVE